LITFKNREQESREKESARQDTLGLGLLNGYYYTPIVKEFMLLLTLFSVFLFL
jgi:hypothetical protein